MTARVLRSRSGVFSRSLGGVRGGLPVLYVTPRILNVGWREGETVFYIFTTESWEIGCDDEWVEFSEVSGTGNAEITVYYEVNNTFDERDTIIEVSSATAQPDMVKVKLNQEAGIQIDAIFKDAEVARIDFGKTLAARPTITVPDTPIYNVTFSGGGTVDDRDEYTYEGRTDTGNTYTHGLDKDHPLVRYGTSIPAINLFRANVSVYTEEGETENTPTAVGISNDHKITTSSGGTVCAVLYQDDDIVAITRDSMEGITVAVLLARRKYTIDVETDEDGIVVFEIDVSTSPTPIYNKAVRLTVGDSVVEVELGSTGKTQHNIYFEEGVTSIVVEYLAEFQEDTDVFEYSYSGTGSGTKTTSWINPSWFPPHTYTLPVYWQDKPDNEPWLWGWKPAADNLVVEYNAQIIEEPSHSVSFEIIEPD
jgi:hypothetical protein